MYQTLELSFPPFELVYVEDDMNTSDYGHCWRSSGWYRGRMACVELEKQCRKVVVCTKKGKNVMTVKVEIKRVENPSMILKSNKYYNDN